MYIICSNPILYLHPGLHYSKQATENFPVFIKSEYLNDSKALVLPPYLNTKTRLFFKDMGIKWLLKSDT